MLSLPLQQRMHGLIAATHTPFHEDGSLNLSVIERQAEHLLENKVSWAFIGGSTGESHSLTLEERRALTQRWSEVARGSQLRVVVHVGANCLADAKTLAAQAEGCGAAAISALCPSYFKPRSLELLIASMAEIAHAATRTPFYYYDIPQLTNVSFSMPDFLAQARDRVPTLAGIKFSHPDLMAYQLCLRAEAGAWDIPFGCDEFLLAAVALGAQGAVGSTYNFAANVYHRVLAAVQRGDLKSAQNEQFRSVQLVQLLASYGYMGAAKGVMSMLGVPVGPARLPNGKLSTSQYTELQEKLTALGYFEWIKA
jgi:N-acetylneuraminate lyase